MSKSPRLVRFVVAVQRRPAVATLATYVTLLLVAWAMRPALNARTALGFLTFAACAATALAETMPATTAMWTRVVVYGLGFGTALPLTIALFDDGPAPLLVTLMAVSVGLPHIVAATGRAADFEGRWTRICGLLIVALVVALLAAVPEVDKATAIICGIVGWVVAVQVAFDAVAANSLPLALFTALALVVGALLGQLIPGGGGNHAEFETGMSLAVGWSVGALLLPLARAGRGLTAVPDDHPIYADFGGARA